MALNNYITQVQRLLHDPQATFYSTTDLTAFINLARRQIAAKSKSVRLLLPSTNGIASVAVTAAGNNYVGTPTISFTGTGTGATAHATMNGQTVATIVVDTAGTGYDNTTVVVITPTNGGSGATATATINCWNTVTGQEVYTFAAANAFAQLTSGVSGILGVESIAVSWGAMKPMLKHWVWSDFQAYLRSNNTGLQSWPTVWSSMLRYIMQTTSLAGGETPDFIVMAPGDWTTLVQDFMTVEQFQTRPGSRYGADDVVNAGFRGVMLGDVPIFVDLFCPKGTAYFFNSRYLALYMSEDAPFAFSGFYSSIPNLQIANIGVVLVAFNVVCTKPVSGLRATGITGAAF